MVSVQDEDGNYVAGSIIYMEGINTYVFHESGPISGIRSAFLERIDSPCCNSCNNIWYTQPHHVQANFRNGQTYMFHLEPSDVHNNK